MDWIQPITNLCSAIVGGVLVILGDRIRQQHETRDKKVDTIISLYTDFFVQFQLALHHNEAFWSGARWQLEGKGESQETERGREGRFRSETAFREAAWRLRLRETDRDQQQRIESLARAFDDEVEDAGEFDAAAFGFDAKAKELREEARLVVDRMQRIHKRTLKPF